MESNVVLGSGALLGDAAWALAALTGVAALAGGVAVRIGMGLVGGLFLFLDRLARTACRLDRASVEGP